MSDKLRKAVQLVLALHESGTAIGFSPNATPTVRLDPMAEAQLRDALTEPEPESVTDIASLRALQHAANGLNYTQFCDALGWQRDDYSLNKWREYQLLGRIGVFDDETLLKPIGYYKLLGKVRA